MRYRRGVRAASIVVALAAALGFGLVGCPSYRDGMPGQLAAAKEEARSAGRSGALALQLWSQGRTTRNLTCVQLADARDEVVKAYRGVAVLDAEDPVDVGRQRLLTRSMGELIDALNTAGAAVRALPGQPDPQVVRRQLLDGVEALEREYR